MGRYAAVLFADLERHSSEWNRVPRDEMVELVSQYRQAAESLASRYGALYREWAGDGHMFLFENADSAAQFGLKLLDAWRGRGPALRLGCHFGECTPLAGGEGWIGRGNAIAKRVESEAEPHTLYVTESVLDLLDLPLYEFEPVSARPLKGDYLEERRLYRMLSFDRAALAAKPREELTAEEWFLKAAALIGTAQENSAEEEESYREALRLRPDYPEAHNNLAILLRARGADTEAARHYQEALDLRPDYPEAHYNYAAMLASRGAAAGAAEHYREALRLRPDYVDAHHGYANLLVARGELDDARTHYEEALRLRPHYPEAHNDYAILLEQADEPEQAVEHYREALRLGPDYPEAHYNYALLLESRGDRAGAEDHYRAALGLWPDYGEAHNNLAILLQEAGDLERAEHHYREALRSRPDEPETHYNLALLLRRKGDERGAAKHFGIAFELAPEVPAFRRALETPR